MVITDEGMGIPQAEHDLIFSKFYRRADGQQEGMGAGLGLFIAEGLVSAMGEACAWRPSKERARASPSSFLWCAKRLPRDRVPRRRRRCSIRLLCRVNLEAEGMEVLEAADGADALEKARSAQPDVVLLDVLPKLDGWRVAEALLEDPKTGEIPIVFLTARAELRDQARGLEIGGSTTSPSRSIRSSSPTSSAAPRARRAR